MVMEPTFSLTEISMKGNSRTEKRMVKVHTPYLMEESISGNGRMGNIMVKVHSLSLMEESMWGNTKIIKDGTEQNTTKKVTFLESMWKGDG